MKRQRILITARYLVDDAMQKLTEQGMYRTHFISGIVLIDGDADLVRVNHEVQVIPLNGEAIRRIRSKWVDEVF